jgi:cobalt-zinc-cadmium efflux system outer membrane protein
MKRYNLLGRSAGWLLAAWCLLLLPFSQALRAQQADSLAEWLGEAARNNPGLQARFNNYQAALQKVPQASALPDPQFQAGFLLRPMDLLMGRQFADFRIMQMAPWFGTLKAAGDEASLMAKARYEEFIAMRNDLWFRVKGVWYQVFYLQSEINITRKNIDLLESIEKLATIRYQAGGANNAKAAGGMADVLRVRMETATLQNRLELLNDELETAKVRFNSLLDRGMDNPVYLPDSLELTELPYPLERMADSVLGNPEILRYRNEIAAGEARVEKAKKLGLPSLGIGLDYSIVGKRPDLTSSMNGKDMIMPMVTATIPLNRKKYNAMEKESGFLLDASKAALDNTRNTLEVRFAEARQHFEDASRRMVLYKGQSSLAEKTITLLTASYSAGGAGFDEILRMEQQLLDYRLKESRARVDRNTAVAEIISLIANE